jgi:alcohol dehydrogenase
VVVLKAAVLYGPRRVRVEDKPLPKPEQGWVLVRTRLVGICGTDKAFYTGRYRPPKLPLVPGHEVVGEVVAGADDLVGARVVSEINLITDWSHPVCRAGLYTHCPPNARRVLGIDFDGAMAEYFVSRREALHRVNGVSDEQAIFVEPLAAVLRAFKINPLPPRSNVAVLGTGPLALLAAQVLRYYGASVVVVARPDSPKKKFFRELGLKVVDLGEAIEIAKTLNEGLGFDAVVEATGSPEALNQAIGLVRPLGIVYLKSTHGQLAGFNQTLAVVKEVTLVGSRCGTSREFKEAIQLLAKGVIRVKITAQYALDDAREAFEASLERSHLKVAVRP